MSTVMPNESSQLTPTIDELLEKANKGDAESQFQLGEKYRNGEGVTQDDQKALDWYYEAAKQGDAGAQFELGMMCMQRKSVSAYEWFQKAADQGRSDAQYYLGLVHALGMGVPRDIKKAVGCLQKAGGQGNTRAQFELGVMYEDGKGVSKDEKTACEWYRKAVGHGHEEALECIRKMVERNPDDFRIIPTGGISDLKSKKEIEQGIAIKIIMNFVKEGKVKELEELLKANPRIMSEILISKGKAGNTVMHWAAMFGQSSMIGFLSKRCDLNEQNGKGESPFLVALKHGNITFAQNILRCTSQENLNQILECINKAGQTILQAVVVSTKLTGALEFLLGYKPNLKHQDKEDRSVLHLAVIYENIKALEILLSQHYVDLDLNLRDKEGRTALHLAAEQGFVPAIQLLCSRRAYLEALDNKNRTPLHCAIECTRENRLDAVNVLLRFGANIRGALELAKRLNHIDVVGCLNNFKLADGKPLGGAGARIKNLVFQGGSVKGIAYFGALEALGRQQIISLKEIERVGGTSAGAITAVLLAVGYTLPEVEKILNELDFKEFLDNPIGGSGFEREDFLRIKKIYEERGGWFDYGVNGISITGLTAKVRENFGLFRGDYLRQWMEERIKDKTKTNNTTFREHAALCERHGLEKFKHLYLVGTNASTGRTEVFSHEHTPEMIIADALRISVSIPVLLMPHYKFIKNPAGQRVKGTNDLYIDGGVSDNYPLWLFDNSRYLDAPKKDMKERAEGFAQLNPETLGFRLVTYKIKQEYERGIPLESRDIQGILQFLCSIANCYWNKQESDHSRIREDRERSIYIDELGISMFSFDLKEEDKRNLKNAGFRAAHEYVERAKLSGQKITLAPPLAAALMFASRNPLVVNGEKGLEIQHIVLNPRRIPRLIYKFYTKGTKEDMDFLESLPLQFNAQDNKKNSAVHLAVRFGKVVDDKYPDEIDKTEWFKKLLSKIHLDMINAEGKTALDLAYEKGNEDGFLMMKMLVEEGARRVLTENISKIKEALRPCFRGAPHLRKMLDGLKTSEQHSSPLRAISGEDPTELEKKQQKEGLNLVAGVDFEQKGSLDKEKQTLPGKSAENDASIALVLAREEHKGVVQDDSSLALAFAFEENKRALDVGATITKPSKPDKGDSKGWAERQETAVDIWSIEDSGGKEPKASKEFESSKEVLLAYSAGLSSAASTLLPEKNKFPSLTDPHNADSTLRHSATLAILGAGLTGYLSPQVAASATITTIGLNLFG